MFTKKNKKIVYIIVLTTALLLAITSIAIADNLNQNDVSGDPPSTTLTAGDSESYIDVDFFINPTGVGSDGDAGCNFDAPSEHLKFTINTPYGVTANPSTLTFTECKSTGDFNAQTVRFSAGTSA
jgi:hypothetical protein